VGHVAAPELPSQEGKAPSHGTRGSTEAPLSGRQSPDQWDMWQHRSFPLRNAEPGAVGHVAVKELTSQEGEVRSRGTHGSAGAHLSMEVRSRVVGHVVGPEPTSVGRCGLKLQLMWQRVDARPTPCLDLEIVCGGTRSLGYRQRARPHLRRGYEPTGGANSLMPCSIILNFLLSSQWQALAGAGAEGLGAPTINAKKHRGHHRS
jgi:hypothetical protein